MEQLNSNIERVIEAGTTIEVLNVGAFYALVKAYKYVVVSGKSVKEKINVPFTFDLYNKDNEKISSGTISPGEKATFKVQTYKMIINNTYDYEVHIVFSFGSGTVDQLKTDLELNTEDIAALTAYDKQDFDLLTSINSLTFQNLESLAAINAIMTAQTAIDKTPVLINKSPVFISLASQTNVYFNVFDLKLQNTSAQDQPYFISYVDVSFDYSQALGYATNLVVTNTFNPGMSFGHYARLKDLTPDTQDNWNTYKWTNRADIKLPTMSKSLSISNGFVNDDGHFRVDINDTFGNGSYFNNNNFIIRTDVSHNTSAGSNSKVAIRKYTDDLIIGVSEVVESVLPGDYQFRDYNKCSRQKPIISTPTNMVVVDVCVYGYLLPVP